LLKRINTLGYNIKISEKAKDFVAEKGFDAQFGARPLKRAIQKYIEDPLAEDIINSNLKEGDTIALDTNKEETVLKIKISKPRKESKKAKDKLKG
jgi:ATP-dependent Clp protease ATP-binding subunit ClpC